MNVMIFHGWGADSTSNWFKWLKEELESKGVEVYCPDLPNSDFPNQEEWIKTAMSLPLNKDTILVGHSLGTILSLRLIEKIKLHSAYLVSIFDDPKGYKALKGFFKEPFDYEKIKKNCKNIFIMNSDDDPVIDIEQPRRIAERISAKLKIFHELKHMNEGTGNCKFPELRDMILKDISNK